MIKDISPFHVQLSIAFNVATNKQDRSPFDFNVAKQSTSYWMWTNCQNEIMRQLQYITAWHIRSVNDRTINFKRDACTDESCNQPLRTLLKTSYLSYLVFKSVLVELCEGFCVCDGKTSCFSSWLPVLVNKAINIKIDIYWYKLVLILIFDQ